MSENDKLSTEHPEAGPIGVKSSESDLVLPGRMIGTRVATSSYRGVCWHRKSKRWQSAINSSGRHVYLGSFDTEEEAARMFDKVAIRVRGAKAKLNFPYSDYVGPDGNLLTDPKLEQLVNEARKALLVKQRWLEANEDGRGGGKRRRLGTAAGSERPSQGDVYDLISHGFPGAGLNLDSTPSFYSPPGGLGSPSRFSMCGGTVVMDLGSNDPTAIGTFTERELLQQATLLAKPGDTNLIQLQPNSLNISTGCNGGGSSSGVALGPMGLGILYANAVSNSAAPPVNFLPRSMGVRSAAEEFHQQQAAGSHGTRATGISQRQQTELQTEQQQQQLGLPGSPSGACAGRMDDRGLWVEPIALDGTENPAGGARAGASAVGIGNVRPNIGLGVHGAKLSPAAAISVMPPAREGLAGAAETKDNPSHGWEGPATSAAGRTIAVASCLRLNDCSLVAGSSGATTIKHEALARPSQPGQGPSISNAGYDLDLVSLISTFLEGVRRCLPIGTEIESLIPCADGSLLGYTFVRVPKRPVQDEEVPARNATEAIAARAMGCSSSGAIDGCGQSDAAATDAVAEDPNANRGRQVGREAKGTAACLHSGSGSRTLLEQGAGGSSGNVAAVADGDGVSVASVDTAAGAGIFFRGVYRDLGTYGSTADAVQACKACMTVLLEFKEKLMAEAAAAVGAVGASSPCEPCSAHTNSAGQPPATAPLRPAPSAATALDQIISSGEVEPQQEAPSGVNAGAHQLCPQLQLSQHASTQQPQQPQQQHQQEVLRIAKQQQDLRNVVDQLQNLVQQLSQQQLCNPQQQDLEDYRQAAIMQHHHQHHHLYQQQQRLLRRNSIPQLNQQLPQQPQPQQQQEVALGIMQGKVTFSQPRRRLQARQEQRITDDMTEGGIQQGKDDACLSGENSQSDGNGLCRPQAAQRWQDLPQSTSRMVLPQSDDVAEAEGMNSGTTQWRRQQQLHGRISLEQPPESPSTRAVHLGRLSQLIASLLEPGSNAHPAQLQAPPPVNQGFRSELQQHHLQQHILRQETVNAQHQQLHRQQQQQQQLLDRDRGQLQQPQQLASQLQDQESERCHLTLAPLGLAGLSPNVLQLHTILQQVQHLTSGHCPDGGGGKGSCIGTGILQELLAGSVSASGGVVDTGGCIRGKPNFNVTGSVEIDKAGDHRDSARVMERYQHARNPSGSCDSTDDDLSPVRFRHRASPLLGLGDAARNQQAGFSHVRSSDVMTQKQEGLWRMSSADSGGGEGDCAEGDGEGNGSNVVRHRQNGEHLAWRQKEAAAIAAAVPCMDLADAMQVVSYSNGGIQREVSKRPKQPALQQQQQEEHRDFYHQYDQQVHRYEQRILLDDLSGLYAGGKISGRRSSR